MVRDPNLCDWCLERFDSSKYARTQQELGYVKTKLTIPDAHVPHICPVCFNTVREAPLLGITPTLQGNRLLGY
jgi:hypothetical protein